MAGCGQRFNFGRLIVYTHRMITDFSAAFPLKARRTHEVYGQSAVPFALSLAGQVGGVVMWVSEGWQAEPLNPIGISPFMDPQNLLTTTVKSHDEGLGVAEESLRSGAVALTVFELTQPLSFTAGRRLQLAAEAGGALGLCIIPEGMGNNAAESRWHCAPIFDPEDSTLQRWEIIKNKSGTLTMWDVRWDAEARRIIVVSEVAQRAGSARAPD